MKAVLTIALALLLAWGMSACRSTRKIQTAIAKIDSATVAAPKPDLRADSIRFMQETYQHLTRNRIDFNTFSAKLKVDFEGKDGKKSDFNAFLRLRKDSLLWVSVNVALGFEAFRVIITPDTVKLLNKMDKIVQVRSVTALQEITRLPFTFAELQNVIMGNPVFIDSNIISYANTDQAITLYTMNEVFKHMLTLNKSDYTLQNSKLDDIDLSRSRTCLILYANYQPKNEFRFSAYRKITVTEKTKVDIQIDYKQFEFNEALSYPFSIPKNYKWQ